MMGLNLRSHWTPKSLKVKWPEMIPHRECGISDPGAVPDHVVVVLQLCSSGRLIVASALSEPQSIDF